VSGRPKYCVVHLDGSSLSATVGAQRRASATRLIDTIRHFAKCGVDESRIAANSAKSAANAQGRWQPWMLSLFVLVAAIVLWLPALSTPFWGDDYHFLQRAMESRLAGEPWWRPFWPNIRYQFWRPLGHETYWHLIESVLRADAAYGHIVNFVLWLLCSTSVGIVAAALATALSWEKPAVGGALAAAVYSVLAVHFTPMHWTASGDSLLLLLWSALALAAWTGAPMLKRKSRWFACAAIPLLQLLALFSKESAVLLPALMACMSAFIWPRAKPALPEVAVWVVSSLEIIVWLCLRVQFVMPSPPEYAFAFEGNILRNLAALLAWSLNVPREALRSLTLDANAIAILWALCAAIPMWLAIRIAAPPLGKVLSRRQFAFAALFFLLAYAPYYALARQSYEYYAQVAMILPAVLMARGIMWSTRAPIAMLLIVLSSFVAVEFSRMIDYPGLIGRARMAENQLGALGIDEGLQSAGSYEIGGPLALSVSNSHAFYAVGLAGLAWRLALFESDVVIGQDCAMTSGDVLAFKGPDVYLAECAAEDRDE
jgi:hypothetical protein